MSLATLDWLPDTDVTVMSNMAAVDTGPMRRPTVACAVAGVK
jgi:hypothetical protein